MKFTNVNTFKWNINIYIILYFVFFFIPISICSNESDMLLEADEILTPLNKRLETIEIKTIHTIKFDDQIKKFVDYYSLKGVSVAIVKDEKLVYAKAFGFADEIKNQETNPNHLFRIASVSKLITAVSIFKLLEENKIKLTDKVFGKEGFFSEEKFLNIKDNRLKEITVLNLLNHSSGWTQRYGDPMFNPLIIASKVGEIPPIGPDAFIKFVISRNLDFSPGTNNSYSNMGYLFLGLIIEKVTGLSYEDYVRQYILFPNGIYDMHIAKNLYSDKFENEVAYYEQFGSEKILPYTGDTIMLSKVNGGNDITLLGGAGAWIASAAELAKLLVVIDGFREKKDFLSDESISLMTGGLGETLGWKETENGSWIRTGSFAGTSAMIYRGVDGLSWVFLSNTSGWNGPFFSNNIKRFMNSSIVNVADWPSYDLFYYYSKK